MRFLVDPSLDRALERCEEIVIDAWKSAASLADERRTLLLELAAGDLERHLERQIRFEDLMVKLRTWLAPSRYAAGEALAGPGTASAGLQLLTSGQASAHAPEETRFCQEQVPQLSHFRPCARGNAIASVRPGRRTLARRPFRRESAHGPRGRAL